MARLSLIFLFIFIGLFPAAAQDDDTGLRVISGETTHAFTVEIVAGDDALEQAMSGRTELAADAGMLFDFGETRQVAFWMKDTPLPLDILFMSADGTIVAIAREAVPQSLRRISPGAPVRSVLEINGGRSEALGIVPGDRVEHALFAESVAP
ncbi:MAG: DUF192 domain-containing protein [Pseudomonadota bacterium]